MAVKDHSLDEKIIKAAKEEFAKCGFQKASLHKIAENAGLTTGAIYTRYKNKDELFCSLFSELGKEIYEVREGIGKKYYAVKSAEDVDGFIEALRYEQEIYTEILFKHYDLFKMYYCKSAGSSIEENIRRLSAQKAKETVEYLQKIAKKPFDVNTVMLILSFYNETYKEILNSEYDEQTAKSCFADIQRFLEAGWRDFFNRIK